MYFILYASSGCTVHLAQVRFSCRGGNVEEMESRPAEDRSHSRHIYGGSEPYNWAIGLFLGLHPRSQSGHWDCKFCKFGPVQVWRRLGDWIAYLQVSIPVQV